MSEKIKATAEIKKIIRKLGGDYQDDIDSDTLKKWEAHAMLLYEKSGLSVKEIDKTLNDLFWSVAGEFGA